MFPVCAFTSLVRRPAEGHLRRCLVVGRHRAKEIRLKRPEGVRAVGRSETPQGEELRSDAALSPGRHSPGALRVPRLPGSGTFRGCPRPWRRPRPSHPLEGWVRAETRLRPPREGRSARPGIKALPSAGCPGPGPKGTWPLGPGPAIRGFTHRRWTPAARGLQTREADPAPRTRPGAPRARPSLLFEGRARVLLFCS